MIFQSYWIKHDLKIASNERGGLGGSFGGTSEVHGEPGLDGNVSRVSSLGVACQTTPLHSRLLNSYWNFPPRSWIQSLLSHVRIHHFNQEKLRKKHCVFTARLQIQKPVDGLGGEAGKVSLVLTGSFARRLHVHCK